MFHQTKTQQTSRFHKFSMTKQNLFISWTYTSLNKIDKTE